MKNFKIKANKNKKSKIIYPYIIYMSNGRKIPLPSQHKFKSSYVRNHGCSLVGFYTSLRFLGVKKNMTWCKKYLDKHYGLHGHSKYNLKQVSNAINKIISGSHAKYYKKISEETLRDALVKGRMVLFEERDPIHTIVLMWSDGKTIRFSDGKYKRTTVNKELAKRCGDDYYGGCIVIKK